MCPQATIYVSSMCPHTPIYVYYYICVLRTCADSLPRLVRGLAQAILDVRKDYINHLHVVSQALLSQLDADFKERPVCRLR